MKNRTPEESNDVKTDNKFKHSSTGLLSSAIAIQEQRARDYDQPEGERSMAATVTAFNAITRREGNFALLESEGWLLMQILKDVRDRAGMPHFDSLLDCVSYASLKAESRLRESECEAGKEATGVQNFGSAPAFATAESQEFAGPHEELPSKVSVEQRARDILKSMGVPGAHLYTAGDLVELANLITVEKNLNMSLGHWTRQCNRYRDAVEKKQKTIDQLRSEKLAAERKLMECMPAEAYERVHMLRDARIFAKDRLNGRAIVKSLMSLIGVKDMKLPDLSDQQGAVLQVMLKALENIIPLDDDPMDF